MGQIKLAKNKIRGQLVLTSQEERLIYLLASHSSFFLSSASLGYYLLWVKCFVKWRLQDSSQKYCEDKINTKIYVDKVIIIH